MLSLEAQSKRCAGVPRFDGKNRVFSAVSEHYTDRQNWLTVRGVLRGSTRTQAAG
jgi:hypothetical protein